MTNEELKAKAERVEHRPDGDYYIFNTGDLTAEEFSEIMMDLVRERQQKKEP